MASFEDLVQIVRSLRAPDGCPWDRAQTFETLAPYVIEEAYELADTLENLDPAHLQEELGDVLLHVIMISVMASEHGHFGLPEVIGGICDKMIRRHPHVFGTTKVDTVDQVLTNWEAIKQTENTNASPVDSIPKHLPAISRAVKLQKRAAKSGFTWETPGQDGGSRLFDLLNELRQTGVDPEQLLRQHNERFTQQYLEWQSQQA